MRKLFIYSVLTLFFANTYVFSKNELYEDEKGSIYVAVDHKGIYKLSFKYFAK